jgi:hypothetical protein
VHQALDAAAEVDERAERRFQPITVPSTGVLAAIAARMRASA